MSTPIYIRTNESTSGGVSESKILEIVDDSLFPIKAIIGNPTSNNTSNQIVKRDGTDGGFSTGTVKATSLEVSGTTKLAMPLKDFAGTNILNVVNDNTHVGKDISVTGTYNTAVGSSALKGVIDATLNTAVGVRSLELLTTSTHNVAMGYRAGSVGTALTTGTKCTLIGADARTTTVNMTNSTAIGYTSVVDADNCIQLGNNGVTAVKTSGTLYAAGLESLGPTPTILNIASQNNTNTVNIGSGAGVQAINIGNSGTGKTTIKLGSGTDEVQVNLPLKDSTGANILQMAGTNNVLVGKNTMPLLSSGTNNVVLGNNAAVTNTTGSFNTLIGTGIAALGTGTTGWNTVVGNEALVNVSTGGIGNVVMGNKALYLLTSGGNNTAIGMSAGYNEVTPAQSAVTGKWSTFIGANACPLTGALNNATAIGYQATVDANDTIQLGNTSVTAVKTNGTLYAAGLESIGTNSTLTIAGSDNTKVVEIGKGTGVQVINIGNSGAGATTINIGSGLDTVTLGGSISSIEGTVVNFKDPTIVFGYGSAANSSGGSGVYLAKGTETLGCYMRLSSDRTKFEFKPRVGANTFVIDQSLQTTDDVTFKSVACTNGFSTGAITSTGIVRSSGLTLPNAGGTAYGSTLNHYEEYSAQMKFNNTVVETPLLNYQIVRIGKQVTFTIKDGVLMQSSSTGEFMTMNTHIIPSRFLPTHTIPFPIIIIQNNTRLVGKVVIDMSDSKLHIVGAGNVNFTNGMQNGFEPFSITYLI